MEVRYFHRPAFFGGRSAMLTVSFIIYIKIYVSFLLHIISFVVIIRNEQTL